MNDRYEWSTFIHARTINLIPKSTPNFVGFCLHTVAQFWKMIRIIRKRLDKIQTFISRNNITVMQYHFVCRSITNFKTTTLKISSLYTKKTWPYNVARDSALIILALESGQKPENDYILTTFFHVPVAARGDWDGNQWGVFTPAILIRSLSIENKN